jgi:excisionase family DNA binding protein
VDQVDRIFYAWDVSDAAYLTIPEVAAELRMTASGVYKLIQRGKLPAVRHSERGTRITRWALDAYQRRLNGDGPELARPRHTTDLATLRDQFVTEAGRSPEDWIARWKRNLVEDTAENSSRLVRALGLRELARTDAALQSSEPGALQSRPPPSAGPPRSSSAASSPAGSLAAGASGAAAGERRRDAGGSAASRPST